MEKLFIRGGQKLAGRIQISGAKNSAVALIPAAILADGEVILDNVPDISDVHIYSEILQDLGAVVERDNDTLRIDSRHIEAKPMPNGKVKELRASYYLMGAMLGRFGQATVGMPGGCNLGPRPIDQHIKGFEALGATLFHKHGALHIEAKQLVGNKIFLDVVSVGATINIMLAACRAKGKTVIENAAKEPEIIDVATLLNAMGANIKGAGTDVIRIEGTKNLHGCRHSIIPDRIEAGTYMIFAAATGGDVVIDNIIPRHLESLIAKLREMNVRVEEDDDAVRVIGNEKYEAIDIRTLPYPGFATDLQQPITSLLTAASGTSIVTDNIYHTRFKHVDHLLNMGAKIKVEGRSAVIEGRTLLTGTRVTATDLRAGAALIVAGLMAEGVTEITGVHHIDRGYANLEEKLRSLGADMWREKPIKSAY
ncbi:MULTISPECIES: UDP-N-acetylglucosamine 1-carboxyvinyltransferase [Aneurinibacillus]|uniref:UDP-N-acetylglucosamine 1-carboxyvinyltransferase n=1 Tax=Aneurinibacillus thermoaerophilus TaxID=143495 RepID=A0ABX8YAA3_ANETH|nr:MULTISPECIES: UDP-N-acetylglucosamine 1-carboxyvinyltransferase [Aneurinibacillus]AMA71611.1 UDP-N-acetylglucosamine 1-carboxyvinyltransferase [Aneurinibacillus sp. XH2]MED0676824.1 UDP-N-acetylglucosamine 1-carboxyvinyltransferase [Aneurinibacillus thermoaerophilus]MED0681153.1 UDP-N-acetylglucosamine 1-carboxyvinyltransferase [Aneurinibacillus thermoaerophilus]MED0735708.1 UDP-N-acetylglucosamine 1-carboxyvinyltransferase [Aneurinibacillus thermoaerophilus]MED0757591.1 UDP-N-acetylglucosa